MHRDGQAIGVKTRLLDIILLAVEWIQKSGIYGIIAVTNLGKQPGLGILFAELVGCNGCSACAGVRFHPDSVQFSDVALCIDANMARTHNEHMTSIWYMVHKRSKTSLSNEGKASQASHIERAPHMGKFVV